MAEGILEQLAKEVASGEFDREANLPAVKPPTLDPKSLLDSVKALKAVVDVREGRTGSILDKSLTLRDLIKAGAVEVNIGGRTLGGVTSGGLSFGGTTGLRPFLTTPPTLTNFTVTGMFKFIFLEWEMLEYANHLHVEIWRASTDSLGSAVKIGVSTSNIYVDEAPGTGTKYYWVRAVGYDTNYNEIYGAYNAVSGTAGGTLMINGTDITALSIEAAQLASGAITASKLAAGAVEYTTFAAGIRPPRVVSALPTLPDAAYADGDTVVLTTDGKLYRLVSGAWTAAVPTTDLTGTISGSQIANSALTAAKFASSIEPVGIVSAVPGTKSTNTIFNTTDGKLYRWNGSAYVASVLTSDLSGTIADAQIAAVAASKITGQVVASQIADAAVTTAKFAASIEPVTIVSAVPGTKSTNAIFNTTDGKLYRWNGSAYVATLLTSDLSGTVSDAQIAGLAASKITGTISSSQIADAAVTVAKFASSIEPVTIVTGALPGVKSTNTIFLTSDGKLYRWNGSAYVATVPTTDLSGTVSDAQIAGLAASKITGQLSDSQLAAIAAAKVTGTLTASQLAVTIGGANLLANSSFEADTNADGLADSWVAASGSAGTVTYSIVTTKTHGAKGQRIDTTALASGGYAEVSNNSTFRVPVQPGSPITGSCYVQGTATQQFRLYVEFFDGGGTTIAGTLSQTATDMSATGWQRRSISGTVPATAVTARLVCRMYGNGATSAAYCIIDAAQLELADLMTAYAPRPDEILPSTITSTEIADNAITTPKLVAGAVVAGKIAANAVSATEIAAGAVTTAKIAAGAVTANEIAANTITAAKIAAGTITATELAAGSVTTAKIAAGAVTATEIAASTITGGQIAAGTITSANIATDTITAGNIAAGAIGASEIASGAVTTSKLAVGDFTVQARNWNFEEGDTQWTKETGWAIVSDGANAKSGSWVGRYQGTAAAALRNSQKVPVTQGETFYAEAYVKHVGATGSGSYVRICGYNSAGSEAGSFAGATYVPASTTTYTLTSVSYTVPAGVASIDIQVVANLSAGTAYADEVRLFRTSSSTLIADGAITTAKVAANAITANEIASATIIGAKIAAGTIQGSNIAAGTITAGNIAAATITGAEIAADTITAGQIAAGAISTSELAAGAVTTAKIAAGAVTANEIAANTITAGKIAAATITGAEIAASTIQAGNIASGAITTAKLAAGAVTANELAANAVTAGKISAGAISATEISASAITTDKLALNAVTTAKLAAGAVTANEIAANTITAGQIAAGAIGADQIAAGAIRTDKLLVTGVGSALNSDPNTQDASAWTGGAFSVVTDTASPNGRALEVTSTGATTIEVFRAPLDPNRNYQARVYARQVSGSSTCYLGIEFTDAAGAVLNTGSGWPKGIGTYHYYGLGNEAPPASYTLYSVAFGPNEAASIPAGARYVRMLVLGNYTGSGVQRFASFRLSEKAGADLIVDGSIVATKLAANSIAVGTAAIENGAISNAMIANLAVDDAKIASASVAKLTTGEVQVGTDIKSTGFVPGSSGWRIKGDGTAEFSFAMIRGTLQAGQIGAGFVTANEIDSRNLTIKDSAGNVILAAGSPLSTVNMQAAAGSSLMLHYGRDQSIVATYAGRVEFIADSTTASGYALRITGGWSGTTYFAGGGASTVKAYGLVPGKTYRMQIRARKIGNPSGYGGFGIYGTVAGVAGTMWGSGLSTLGLTSSWQTINLGTFTPQWQSTDDAYTYFGENYDWGTGDTSNYFEVDWWYFQPVNAEEGATVGATAFGTNLLPNSDQSRKMTWTMGYNPNGATIEAGVVRYASDTWGTDTYALQAGSLRNVYIRQSNRHTGTVDGDNDGFGETIAVDLYIGDSSAADRAPVVPGQRYAYSVYVGNHRCRARVYIAWRNAAGSVISFGAASAVGGPTDTGTNHLGLYVRISNMDTAPAGAASASIMVRKYNTIVGGSDSYLWLAAPQIEAVSAAATGPGPYSPGPASDATQLFSGGQLTSANVSTYIASAAIGTAYIADAAITWAKIGNLNIDANGAIRSGKTAWGNGAGDGWYIGRDSGEASLDIGNDSAYLRYKPSTGLLIKLNVVTLSAGNFTSASFTKSDSITRSLGSVTVTPSGGTAPYTYSWTYSWERSDGYTPTVYDKGSASFSGATAYAYAAANSDCNITVTCTCTVTDANGLTATISKSGVGTFGTGPP